MVEIASVPWNGFMVVSLFAGCGGSSLGYKMAGFRVLWASEFVPAAQDSYKANHTGTIVDGRNIRDVQPEEILSVIGMKPSELDVLDGSPPCQSFSTAGKREKGWGKELDHGGVKYRADDLFFEYIRILRGLKPKVFVAENVSGLVKGVAKGYFLEILRELKASGYRVICKVLDAQWLGVPQARQRTIFVGVREDLELDPVHPKPLAYRYSVADALPWISRIEQSGVYDEGQRTTASKDVSPSVTAQGLGAKRRSQCSLTLGAHGWKDKSTVNVTVNPCPTIGSTGLGSYKYNLSTEVESSRQFTIAEVKRLCAFPDDFILTGTYSQQWTRLGNAVPPVMMFHIARTIRDEILNKLLEKRTPAVADDRG